MLLALSSFFVYNDQQFFSTCCTNTSRNRRSGCAAGCIAMRIGSAYHKPIQEALHVAAQLLAQLPETGGINYVRVFVRYLSATQEKKTVETFATTVEQYAPQKGQKVMTFAQQL